MAGAQVFSLAGRAVRDQQRLGLYQRSQDWSLAESTLRALLALALALALTYQVFSLLPVGFGNLDGDPHLGDAGDRSTGAAPRGHGLLGHQVACGCPVLIFGAGQTAQMVGARCARPTAGHHRRYFPGRTRSRPPCPRPQRLSTQQSLTQTARRLGVDEIVVALTERRSGSMPLRELLDCKLSGVQVFDITTYSSACWARSASIFVNAGWLIFGDGFNQGFYRTAVKRIFDILGSLVLIVVAAPVMLVTRDRIKLESRGPVFYRQERVGYNSKTSRSPSFAACAPMPRRTASRAGATATTIASPAWATSSACCASTNCAAVQRAQRRHELGRPAPRATLFCRAADQRDPLLRGTPQPQARRHRLGPGALSVRFDDRGLASRSCSTTCTTSRTTACSSIASSCSRRWAWC